MPNTIALCGAGMSAAKPLSLPTTFQFFQRTLDDNLDPAHPLGLLANRQTLKAVLSALFQSPNVEGYDLERFYQYLEWIEKTNAEFIKLTSFLFNQVTHNNWLGSKRIELKTVWPSYVNISGHYNSAFDWLEQVAHTLRKSFHWEYDVPAERGEKAHEVYGPLIQLLIDLNRPGDGVLNRVPIYTLNWDTAWEAMIGNEEVHRQLRDRLQILPEQKIMVDGFVEREREYVYDPDKWRRTTNFSGITLVRLHGSILWRRHKRKETISYSLIRDYPDPHSSQEPCLIYPANKGDAVESEPWRSLFNYFIDTLRNAEILLVLGYSFRDEHVNRELLNAVVSNTRIKLVIVNPAAQAALLEADASAKRFFENIPDDRFSYISEFWPEALNEVRRRIDALSAS